MSWKAYEKVATFLLNQFSSEFDLEKVEKKQKIVGLRSKTPYEIDAKGIIKNGDGIILIECRKYKTQKQKQKDMAALAYTIIDTGAKGGIIVSPLNLQKGAQKIANAENITQVILNSDSTTVDYIIQFLNKVMIGAIVNENVSANDESDAELRRKCKKCSKEFIVTNDEYLCKSCSLELL